MTKTSKLIPTLKLNNGVSMPVIGLGTWQLADRQRCVASVKAALKVGFNMVDTASVYKNEQYIGPLLAELPRTQSAGTLKTANGKGIFITSKAAPQEMGKKKVREALLRSLEKLKEKSIDLYLLHWPGVAGVSQDSDAHRRIRAETWKEMEALYHEGKVRAIGVSNYTACHLRQLMEDGATVMPLVNQVELHPLCPQHDIRRACKEMGIVVQAYSPLGSGDARVLEHPEVVSVAEKEGRSPAEVLLRWCTQQGIAVLVRSENITHLEQNFEAVCGEDWQLSANSMEVLSRLCPEDSRAYHTCWDPTLVA